MCSTKLEVRGFGRRKLASRGAGMEKPRRASGIVQCDVFLSCKSQCNCCVASQSAGGFSVMCDLKGWCIGWRSKNQRKQGIVCKISLVEECLKDWKSVLDGDCFVRNMGRDVFGSPLSCCVDYVFGQTAQPCNLLWHFETHLQRRGRGEGAWGGGEGGGGFAWKSRHFVPTAPLNPC